MDWIHDTLAIGSRFEASDPVLIANAGFRSILSLDGPLELADAALHGALRLVHHRFVDGPGNDARLYRRAVQDVGTLLEAAPPLLVHCHAGRSRSVIVVAGHFMLSQGLEPEDALAMVCRKREAAVTAGLERLLWTL